MILYRNQFLILIFSILLEFFVGVIDGSLLYYPSTSDRHNRIENGVNAQIEEHPYLVQLENVDNNVFCGGSILTPTSIITAGHCVEDNPKLFIRAGATNASKGGTKIRVQSIEIHPKYDKNSKIPKYDIAILKLEKPLKFSKKIQLIRLATKRDRFAAKNVGLVAGWGLSKFRSPTILQHALIPIISNKQCNSMYSPISGDHAHLIDSTMFCAFDPNGRDTCSGDSGGPLTVNSKLYGIVSWGEYPCGNPSYPGVYVKLTNRNIRKWIIKRT